MIEYIKGTLAELTPTDAIIETGGVGYQLAISLNTYTAIQGKNETKLYVYEAIREDAFLLYGFAEKKERDLFRLLISVSGIGGQTARMVLSSFSPSELSTIISGGDVKMLKSVKGIGPKAAQRIIVDLKDKIILSADEMASTPASSGNSLSAASQEVVSEAVAALSMLGFSPAASQKVVLSLVKENANQTVEQIIKSALKML